MRVARSTAGATLGVVITMSGCGLGMGDIAPGGQAGVTHYGNTYSRTDGGRVAPDGYVFVSTRERHAGPVAAMFGDKAGFVTASIPGGPSTTSSASEFHFDLMTHGFGVTATYSKENADGSAATYVYSGTALGGFAQMPLASGLTFEVGLARVFGDVGTDGGSASTSADGWRVTGRLVLGIEQVGAALELRSTTSDRAMLNGVDVTWSSISMMFEALYVTF